MIINRPNNDGDNDINNNVISLNNNVMLIIKPPKVFFGWPGANVTDKPSPSWSPIGASIGSGNK